MAGKLSYNNDLLRIKNRGQVFEQLVTHDGIYRMDMVETCGLTKMTISNIVNEFIEKDFIVETVKSEETKLGRKSTLLRLSPGAKKVVGLLIHRYHISVALCDCQLNVIQSETVQFTECNLDFLLETVYALVDKVVANNDILGIGVGSIGPVNAEKGIILNPPDFYGIENVPIVQLLKERYGLPVYLDYHFNCAARAEKYFGLGKYYKNFIFLGIKGLGLSCVVDGKILTRMTGISSEIGHMTVDYNGPECFCGRRGCLGGYMDYTTEEATWNTVKILCTTLMGLCDVLVPQALIIRDEKFRLKKEHLAWMKKEINEKIVARNYKKIEVLLSERNNELEASGCATNILGRVFSGDIEI